jgi:protein phosphatase 1 regulatory subunit 7
VKQERIQNPSSVERAVIESKIAEGCLVILQFDKPPYSPELLGRINNLCGEFGKQLEVRFYGHYRTHFDASVLRFLPDVAALSIDCLLDATNLAVLNDLANLRSLSLGIYSLDDPQFLRLLQPQNLEELSIGESLKVNFDLAPLRACRSLTRLYVEKHTKNIECLATIPALRDLTLRCIPKKQSIGFVSKIQALKRLVVILGGRTNISEIQHPKLEELEILRVMGFDNLDSIATFPSLRSFAIEDQIRLSNIRFTASNKSIQSFKVFNCKTLRTLEGLENLTELKSIRIGTTALDVDSILGQRLPGSLKTFAFFTGKTKENERIRKNLDALGYSE